MRSRVVVVVVGLVGVVGSVLVGMGPAAAAEAQWGLNNAHQGGPATSFGFGSDACSPATGDWDGDGDTNVAGACPRDGEWQWGLASAQGGSPWRSYGYGSTRCTPVSGDWDGDGDTNVGIACPESGEWRWSLNTAHQGGTAWRSYGYGSTRCTPVSGDWDGDGDTNVGIACPESGEWRWSLNSAHQGGTAWRSYGYGSTRCTPVSGDWDGDGDTNVGIACPESGEWRWSLNSAHQGGSPWRTYGFGSTSKLPVTGDWDGDGDTTVGAVNMTAPSSSRGFACPVNGPVSFTDTFGAPRSGGRTHEGVDMFATRGTPVVAVTDGVTFLVENTDNDLGGISMWIRGGDGTEYYYAHHTSNVVRSNGVRVAKGQHIAYVGNTGNARTTPPHLHFEIHPGGGAAINPTPSVDQWCPGHGGAVATAAIDTL